MRKVMGLAIGFAALALVHAAGSRADEEKVPLDKVPKAVLDAVKSKYPQAKLVGASKEKEDGKTVYEVTIKNKGRNADVTVTPEGKVVLVETEIAAKDLPKVVAQALEAKYPKATIKMIEEIAKGDGKVTAYEALIVTASNSRLEVSFDPTGKFLKEEKKGGKEKD